MRHTLQGIGQAAVLPNTVEHVVPWFWQKAPVYQVMIRFHACPRCGGAVCEVDSDDEGPFCVNCGWRRVEIPHDVQKEVEDYQGAPRMPRRFVYKPPTYES